MLPRYGPVNRLAISFERPAWDRPTMPRYKVGGALRHSSAMLSALSGGGTEFGIALVPSGEARDENSPTSISATGGGCWGTSGGVANCRCANLSGTASTIGRWLAGGGTDITARLIAQWLSERLGQQFIVENRAGAATNIGTEAVVHAPADGYTLLLVHTANAINATLYEKLNNLTSISSATSCQSPASCACLASWS
jgi:hypothetical protein